jgi:hypothetical protein
VARATLGSILAIAESVSRFARFLWGGFRVLACEARRRTPSQKIGRGGAQGAPRRSRRADPRGNRVRPRSSARMAWMGRTPHRPPVRRRQTPSDERLELAAGSCRPAGQPRSASTVQTSRWPRYAAGSRLSLMILGWRAAILSSARAGPSGFRRPCSQFRRV